MNYSAELNGLLDAVAGIFIRCFIFGFAVLVFWFGLYLMEGGLGYTVHSYLFDVSRQQFDQMNYYGMTFLKLCVFLFFLFPYIAIKLIRTGN